MSKDINTIKNMMERIGEEITPNEFLSNEKKIVNLVEERGVAATPYREPIKQIVTYVRKYINNLDKDFGEKFDITIKIPDEITKKINFIETLDIYVYITNVTSLSYFNSTGGGGSYFKYDNDRIIDEKLNQGIIIVFGYCFRGMLIERTLTNSLIHEINHYYDAYNDLKSNTKYSRMIKQIDKSSIRNIDYFETDDENKLFEQIVYRLFSETEFNALVSSVYGDLMGFHSTRENFQEDIKKTQAYCVYKNILINYKYLYSLINENNFGKIKTLFNTHNINVNPYNQGIKSFVNELERKTKYLLKKLLSGIGRAASVYYDDNEFKPTPETITLTEEPQMLT